MTTKTNCIEMNRVPMRLASGHKHDHKGKSYGRAANVCPIPIYIISLKCFVHTHTQDTSHTIAHQRIFDMLVLFRRNWVCSVVSNELSTHLTMAAMNCRTCFVVLVLISFLLFFSIRVCASVKRQWMSRIFVAVPIVSEKKKKQK